MKNKDIINNINYFENEIAKKILKKIKISNIIFYITFFLATISFILLIINLTKSGSLIFVSILYLLITLDMSFSQRRYIENIIQETINKSICPEAYINLNLYNANKKICPEKSYNYYLNNISYGYILLGEFNNAEKIIKYLDTRKKDLVLQSQIIKNKIEIAFFKNDIKLFNREVENLNKIIRFLPRKFKKKVRLNIKLKQAVIDRNTTEVNNCCDLLEKNRNLFERVQAAYYRGLVQDRKKKQNYEEYYRYVAENGNNLIIANKAREKLEITEFENKYEIKKHIPYRVFQILVLFIFISNTVFWSMYIAYILGK